MRTYFDIALRRLVDASRAAHGLPKQLTGSTSDFSDMPLWAEVDA